MKKTIYVKNPKTGYIKEMKIGKNQPIKSRFIVRYLNENIEKQEPRTWTAKFWHDNSISDVMNEIVEPDSIEVDQLKMKNELCPEIWDGDVLNEEVRKVLLKNAIEFIKFCKIENLTYKDIILTGSLANYNYTEQSDLDVHVLMDFNKISEDKEFVGEYFRTKKNLWSEKYKTMVKGHEVELYVQDTSEPHTSTGVYSLVKDKWLTKPINKMIGIDTANVQLKSAEIMNNIDDLLDNENGIELVNKVDTIMEKLKKMRKSGLEKEGEFSTENIVFKILRNAGYLDKLTDIKQKSLEKELTLEGFDFTQTLNEVNIKQIIDKAKKVGLLSLGMVVGLLATDISTQELRNAGVPQDLLNKAVTFIKDTNKNYLGLGQDFNKTPININQANKNVINNEKIYYHKGTI